MFLYVSIPQNLQLKQKKIINLISKQNLKNTSRIFAFVALWSRFEDSLLNVKNLAIRKLMLLYK